MDLATIPSDPEYIANLTVGELHDLAVSLGVPMSELVEKS